MQSLSPFVPQRSLPSSEAQQPPRRKIMAWQDTRSALNREIRGAKGFFGSKRSARTPSPQRNSANRTTKISPFGLSPSISQEKKSNEKIGFNSLSRLKAFSAKHRSPKVTPQTPRVPGQSPKGALGALMAARQMQNQRSRIATVAEKKGRRTRIMPKSRIRRKLSSRRRKQTKCQKISKVLTVPCVILLFLLILSIFSWMGVEVNSIYKRINAAITQSSADIEDLKSL